MKKTIEKLAKEHLFIDTLETRNRDSLDFHDVSVWGVKSALELAYTLGMMKGIAKEKQKRRKADTARVKALNFYKEIKKK